MTKAPLLRVGVKRVSESADGWEPESRTLWDLKLCEAAEPEWLAALVVLGHNSLLLKVPPIISRPVASPHLTPT